MDSKYVCGQFVRVAGATEDQEITGFKAAANDVLYTLRDGTGAETKDVSQENITGLNKFNAESWTGTPWRIPVIERLVAKFTPKPKIG